MRCGPRGPLVMPMFARRQCINAEREQVVTGRYGRVSVTKSRSDEHAGRMRMYLNTFRRIVEGRKHLCAGPFLERRMTITPFSQLKSSALSLASSPLRSAYVAISDTIALARTLAMSWPLIELSNRRTSPHGRPFSGFESLRCRGAEITSARPLLHQPRF